MKRFVWWALIALAVFFALQGGEYSTRDLFVLHTRTRRLTHEVDSLQRQVDSLDRFLRLVKSDSEAIKRFSIVSARHPALPRINRDDYLQSLIAGWSSLVARRAHNPKVAGSNPAPAILL
jgi:hypothetical protein